MVYLDGSPTSDVGTEVLGMNSVPGQFIVLFNITDADFTLWVLCVNYPNHYHVNCITAEQQLFEHYCIVKVNTSLWHFSIVFASHEECDSM